MRNENSRNPRRRESDDDDDDARGNRYDGERTERSTRGTVGRGDDDRGGRSQSSEYGAERNEPGDWRRRTGTEWERERGGESDYGRERSDSDMRNYQSGSGYPQGPWATGDRDWQRGVGSGRRSGGSGSWETDGGDSGRGEFGSSRSGRSGSGSRESGRSGAFGGSHDGGDFARDAQGGMGYMGRSASGGEIGGFGSTESYRGRGPKNYKRSDERLTEEICERLTQDHRIDAGEIEVSVSDGEVTLKGQVTDRRQKHMAEDLAESVTGVKDVTNQIRVASSQGKASGEENASTSQSQHEKDKQKNKGSQQSQPQSGSFARS